MICRTRFATVLKASILSLLISSSIEAQEIYLKEGETEKKPSNLVLPFAFSSETLDFTFGLGGVSSATIQPQATFGWGVLGSSNSSYGAYIGGVNFLIPGTERLFVDPLFGVSRYTEMRSYQDLPNGMDLFPGRAGSNESDIDDFIQGEGWDVFGELRFRYLLPMGHGKDDPIHVYRMTDGLISSGFSGGEAFNPFTSGRTYLKLTPFYRNKNYDEDKDSQLLSASNGLRFALEWDNRDFLGSPSKGEHIKLGFNRDFGWFDSDSAYSTWDFEAAKYISLPAPDWLRQNVLALDFWTSDTPTWSQNGDGSVSGRAPEFRSPALGGFNRMRAFPFYRYNDRSAIYYGAEWRIMPEWNPLADIPLIERWLDPDWWQVVPFVEAGRVAPDYDLSTLHEDMQWDAGVSLRFMLKKSVLRMDWATSEDSSSVWVMFGHPF